MFWKYLTYAFTIGGYLVALGFVLRVLKHKREPVAALAWILAIIFLPYVGAVAFLLFGQDHIERPLAQKKRQRRTFRALRPFPTRKTSTAPLKELPTDWEAFRKLMKHLGGFPVTDGNSATFYYDGLSAYGAMHNAIESAQRQISLQTYILQPDRVGRNFIAHLSQKARGGVKVRLLYDAIGSRKLPARVLRPLVNAGGTAVPFMPVNILRRRIQINLRNHRKILVVDGRVGFVGGLNIGREYIGQDPRLGAWRDTHMRIVGPAVESLHHAFAEDWHFATGEHIEIEKLSPLPSDIDFNHHLQIIAAGPDQRLNAIRKCYYAATVRARRRLWMSTPYFIPDESLIDSLRTAALTGVDVRLLTQGAPPDKWLPFLASRYYWDDMLASGVRIWQYGRGMFHAKVLIIDGILASVGTANLDIRSLRLDFEVNCLIYSRPLVSGLEKQFLKDLSFSREVTRERLQKRSGWVQAAENACRLLSPLL